MPNLNDLQAQVEAIPDATPEAWTKAAALIGRIAPDLADMLGLEVTA